MIEFSIPNCVTLKLSYQLITQLVYKKFKSNFFLVSYRMKTRIYVYNTYSVGDTTIGHPVCPHGCMYSIRKPQCYGTRSLRPQQRKQQGPQEAKMLFVLLNR